MDQKEFAFKKLRHFPCLINKDYFHIRKNDTLIFYNTFKDGIKFTLDMKEKGGLFNYLIKDNSIDSMIGIVSTPESFWNVGYFTKKDVKTISFKHLFREKYEKDKSEGKKREARNLSGFLYDRYLYYTDSVDGQTRVNAIDLFKLDTVNTIFTTKGLCVLTCVEKDRFLLMDGNTLYVVDTSL